MKEPTTNAYERGEWEEKETFPDWAKERINEMLWQILPPSTTLLDAENLAIEIHDKIRSLWEK